MKNIAIILMVFLLSGCSYKFNGASIPADMKTVSVKLFENNSLLVVPYLSNDFTEALKIRIRNQTRLNMVDTEGQGVFEGRIISYTINPIAIQDGTTPTAGANRLTIAVSVKYTNTLDATKSFEQNFERFKNFTLTGTTIQALEKGLIKDVNAMLSEDIFNRAFSQW